MPPAQQPYQPGQVFQPQPVQSQPTYDFTQVAPPAPTPAPQPAAPAFDPAAFKQEVIDGVKQAIQPQQPQQPQQPEPQAPTEKKYDEWGAVFQDVDKLVEEKLQARDRSMQEAQQTAAQQEQKNQQIIDSTLNNLRGAGYLPAVTNQFDENDPGKQAENELIGYAVSLGTTDLAKAAQELKFRHDAGFKYDYTSKQFVQVNNPNAAEGLSVFGTLPVTPDSPMPGQAPFMQQPHMQPQMYQQPYGPQNPYMRPQYPAGFNAPVANGGSYMGAGMQGQTPNVSTLRHASYDQLVDMFNRTQ